MQQQLKLFAGAMPTPRRADFRKKKATVQEKAGASEWNLWSQETDMEREMALFFLDIRNFTPFVEKHGAGEVIYVVRKLFSAFQNIIRIHRGQIIETSGDGFYAAFGFDTSVKDAANAAVAAGMSILKNLDLMNESFQKNLHHKIEIGIGVHVGKVATGNILLGAKEHTIVMGYPVNVAARLQGATKEVNNNFVISGAVFELLDNAPAKAPTACISLKGVSAAVPLHLLGQPYRAVAA